MIVGKSFIDLECVRYGVLNETSVTSNGTHLVWKVYHLIMKRATEFRSFTEESVALRILLGFAMAPGIDAVAQRRHVTAQFMQFQIPVSEFLLRAIQELIATL